jgi:hypothetical protein
MPTNLNLDKRLNDEYLRAMKRPSMELTERWGLRDPNLVLKETKFQTNSYQGSAKFVNPTNIPNVPESVR